MKQIKCKGCTSSDTTMIRVCSVDRSMAIISCSLCKKETRTSRQKYMTKENCLDCMNSGELIFIRWKQDQVFKLCMTCGNTSTISDFNVSDGEIHDLQ